MKGRFGKILTDSLALGGRQVLGLALALLQTTCAAKVLGPKGFGAYAIVSVLTMMAGVGNLGFLGAAQRELPQWRARADKPAERSVFVHTRACELLIALLWAAVIGGVAAFQADQKLRLCLAIIASSIFPTRCVSLYQLQAYAEKDFLLQSKIDLMRSILTATLIIGLVKIAGLYIVFLAPVLSNLAAMAWYSRRYSLAFSPGELTLPEFKRLVRIGLPIAGLNILSGNSGIQVWLERTLLHHYLGTAAVGLYAFCSWVSLTILAVFGAVIQAAQPHLYELMSEDLDPRQIGHYLVRPVWTSCLAAILMIGFVASILPEAVRAVLPDYAQGIPAMYILLLSTVLGCFYWIPGVLLYSARLDAQRDYLVFWAAAVTVSTGTSFVLLRAGAGILSTAVGSVLSQGLVLALTLRRLKPYLFPNWESWRGFWRGILPPLGYASLAVAAIEAARWALGPAVTSRAGHLATAAFEGLCFVALSLPISRLFEKRTRILTDYLGPRLKGKLQATELAPVAEDS